MTAVINWHDFDRCPTCFRVKGERCRDVTVTTGRRPLLDSPHPDRPQVRRRVPSLAWADMRLPCACCDALGQSCRACTEDAIS